MIKKTRRQKKEQMQGNWWMEKNSYNLPNLLLRIFLKITNYLPQKYKHKLVYKTGQFILSISRIFYIISRKTTELYQIDGTEKYSNKKLTLFIASNKETRIFFSQFLFNTVLNEVNLGIFSYKKIHKKIIQQEGKYDIAIIKTDFFYQSFFQKNNYVTLPEHINFIKNIPDTIDELIINFSTELREEIDQYTHQNYTYEISSDYKKFVLFYYQMYKPYIQWKHHSTAKIVSFPSIQYLYQSGAKILFVKHNDQIIFGGLFIQIKNDIITYYASFMQNKFKYLEKGVTSLSYYFLMRYAVENKISSIDFGTASPFINEGIFKFKSKWNMTIQHSSPVISQLYSLRFKSNSTSTRSFLLHNPFIMCKEKNLILQVFSQDSNGSRLEKKKHINTLKGLTDIHFTTTRDFIK